MMPEITAMKKLCDDFVKKCDEFIGSQKKKQGEQQ